MSAFTGQAAEDKKALQAPCVEDAMIVFDASGSMSGDGWGYGSESAGSVSRLDKVRATLAEVSPSITRIRQVPTINATSRSSCGRQCRGSHPGCGQSADTRRKNAADIGREASG